MVKELGKSQGEPRAESPKDGGIERDSMTDRDSNTGMKQWVQRESKKGVRNLKEEEYSIHKEEKEKLCI